MESKNILIQIDDTRAKHIAEVLGNKTCQKILKILIDKKLTETDIAKKLNIPLNTVDYNIKKLIKADLIESSSHWWSVKGKKMPVYKISDKKIIITPKKLKSSLAQTLAVTVLLTGIATVFVKSQFDKAADLARYTPDKIMSTPVLESASKTTGAIPYSGLPPYVWFTIGAVFALTIFIILNLRKLK